ncbi:hypothetical protein DH2020_043242 [Rehmannia glutinosa]|uniref:Zinc finger protein n=1 Tax=Rehmannia glutinosa TaxID=99300 RepID=A0ABR0ULW8_REHGL
MGGGESEKEEDWPAPPSVARARLVDAPVLFFVATHKAFRAELASIHRAAAEAAESWAACRELVVDLDRRLEFLRLVYNYHSASEDEEGVYETIMKNECGFSFSFLGQKNGVIFLALDALVKNVVPTYALEHKSIDDKFSSIFRHLDLLMKKDEDAPQMFQELLFSIGTVQTMICQHMHKEEEQVFPLLMQNFTSEEQSKLVWQYMCSVPTILLEEFLPWMTLHLTSEENLDVLHCIKLITPKEKILQEIKFITDVLIFYSNSLDKFVYQLLSLLAKNTLSPCSPLIDEYHIKCLQSLLFYERESLAQLRSFIETLCQELESLVRGLVKNLMFLETEVFPSISESCTSEMQLWLLYTSLHMMPLGLLRCTVTWFSAHLSENQSNSILKNMKLGCPSINKSFASLLYEWVRIGCSGKISIDKFRQNLEEMFNGRSFYLAEQNRQNNVSSGQLLKPNSAMMMKKSVAIPSSSISITTEEHDISYTFGMNHHKFFSQMFKRMPPLQKNLTESDRATFLTLESRPMDLVFYIHRALIKDMEYLVSLSAMLATNFGYLAEFKNRFKFLNKIYQIHSDSEDEIAFPALEAKGALQNISHSYCIDHKLKPNISAKLP